MSRRPRGQMLLESSTGRAVVRQGDALVIVDGQGGEARWPLDRVHTLQIAVEQVLRAQGVGL